MTSLSRWAVQEIREICDDQVDTPEIRRLPQVSWDEVKVEGVLGQGGFSVVHQVEFQKETYALKQLKRRDRSEEDWIMAVFDLCNECHWLASCSHENLVSLKGVCEASVSQAFRGRGYFLLLEKLEGTLQDRLQAWRREESSTWNVWSRLRKPEVASASVLYQRLEEIALGVTKGLSYLHSKEVVLRDLKPQNIGFDAEGTVKLLDLGMARPVHETDTAEMAGTFRYLSPEVILGRRICLESDVYSLAVVLYELATLQKPFEQFFRKGKLVRKDAFYERVVLGRWRPSLSSIPCRATRRLITKCWHASPRARPSSPRIYLLLNQIIHNSESTPNEQPPQLSKEGPTEELDVAPHKPRRFNGLAPLPKQTRRDRSDKTAETTSVVSDDDYS